METALARRDQGRGYLSNIEEYAMGLEALVAQVALIQQVQEAVMHEGEHYGVIPGTNKPTLFKPGAEKLCMVFRLAPDFEIIREIHEPAMIGYVVKCTLVHIPSGEIIASGIGSCNSRETKYRWRTVTAEEVPAEYWAARKSGDQERCRQILGADGSVKKKDGKWYISRKVENDNPWDYDNTILKMAEKRALVAAVLVATAASDIFTQDLEDQPALAVEEAAAPATTAPAAQPEKPARISKDTLDQIIAAAKQLGWGKDDLKNYVRDMYGSTIVGLTVPQGKQLLDKFAALIEEANQALGPQKELPDIEDDVRID